MIVLDEQLAAPDVVELFTRWYPGKVLAVTALRPHARLLDPEITGYLRQLLRYDQLSPLLAQRFDAPALLHYVGAWAKLFRGAMVRSNGIPLAKVTDYLGDLR